MKRKLDETRNLLQLYTHHVGTSEVPLVFHLWGCLSLIAACVSDRVYFRKFRSSKLHPNLFTFLLGPSGCGKGEAIGTVLSYAKDLPQLGTYNGNATAQYLLKHLARKQEMDDGRIAQHAKMYLVMEELAMNIGSGPQAEDFVKHLTGLYKGGDYPIDKGTITGGHTIIRDHCLNVLVGTTVEWAVKCIPRDAIDGGFLGRVAVIEGQYDPAVRIVRPKYPPDYEEVAEHLRERFAYLTQISGEFAMTNAAERIEEQWYVTRPAPEDDAMFPTWKREHDLCLKLAMGVALAEIEEDEPLLIRGNHMETAQRLVVACHKAAPKLQTAAHQTRDSEHLELVRRIIRVAGPDGIDRSSLQRKLSAKGILKERMDEAISTLATEGAITPRMLGRINRYYWEGRRIK